MRSARHGARYFLGDSIYFLPREKGTEKYSGLVNTVDSSETAISVKYVGT